MREPHIYHYVKWFSMRIGRWPVLADTLSTLGHTANRCPKGCSKCCTSSGHVGLPSAPAEIPKTGVLEKVPSGADIEHPPQPIGHQCGTCRAAGLVYYADVQPEST